MQTSKEVIKAAINFTTPERLPVMFEAFGASDVHLVNWNQIGAGDPTKKYTNDEWGCGWERTSVKNMGLVTEHPLLSWESLGSYKWLDADDPKLYEGMEERFIGGEDKYILTPIYMILFERMHSLHGFENTLADLYVDKEHIAYLANRILETQIRIISNISSRFPGQIDGITFTDDWGTELSTFISPDLWRDFFKPRYKMIFDECHKAGWDVWVHSCGKINDIIQDWIDIGVNVLNLQQPAVLGIKEIGKKYSGKICFQSLCDIQKTLPFKSDDEILSEAKLLMKMWGTDMGGFIFSDYGDSEAIGVTEEKKKIMFDAFMENDRYIK